MQRTGPNDRYNRKSRKRNPPHQAFELRRFFVHFPVVRENGDERQLVAGAALVIVRVVGGGNFHGPCAQLHVHQNRVQNHGNLAVRVERVH